MLLRSRRNYINNVVSIPEAVKEFRKEFNITSPVTLYDLKRVISIMGYEMLTYEDNADLIESLKIADEMKRYRTMTVHAGNNAYLVYSRKIPEFDLIFIFAHELGHIYLKHLNDHRHNGYKDTSERREEEANRFAVHLTEDCRTEIKNNVIGIGVVLAVAGIFTSMVFRRK